ncbi:class I SAM-dependent methyltransferase [Montanilutibacter psychrotolerans]|uniref:Methyltransferase domain-containing protein n=1 Tax=Montanilutibacter psychrotolerans TaxID=1327343 RepID=A0A3M8SYC8_9GAMM|nr:class I SAM-dependent methyltransferase [Lysobacter psychrotolerans]RNF84264.1 methyltransferase domain-containing protein [Lysobacter psychrotolerans]
MSERELLRLQGLPAYQNKMFESAAAAMACPRGDVALVQDLASGRVHNAAFDPDRLSYDGSYQNEQGHSPAFQAHVSEVLATIGRHFGAMDILEIGCGKGAFLDLLRAAGHDARGIDPAYEGDSEHIIRRHFEPGIGVRGDAIVMRHVLEHIPAPMRFLESVRDANGGSGRIYIEVPCLEWILQRRAWFDVFYEHVNYFRRADFARMFGSVLESGSLFGGQYIYVVAELDSLRDPAAPGLGAPPPVTLPAGFFASLDRCAQATRPGARSAVWGAAAKGVMFTHHMQARGLAPALAIDINPAKQGRHLAGSGLPVLAPHEALKLLGDAPDVFVMNSNYLSEIRAMGGPGPNYIAVDQT